MEQPPAQILKCKLPLRRNLTLHQTQAYEGARMFYYCFIPTAMISILAGYLFVLERYIRSTQPILQIGTLQLVKSFSIIMLSTIFYFLALKFYQRCNEVDTTPVLGQIELTEQIKQKEINDEGENGLLGQKKPKKHFCNKCEITCDYRTKHCKKCQVCIERFDHHCFWIGNCVGRHNHLPFYLFLLYQTANNSLNFIMISQLSAYLQALKIQIHLILKIMLVGLQLFAIGFIVFTGYLLLYHTMLISNGLTTWQHMRRSRISYLKYLPPGYVPFSKGVIQNWKKFFTQSTRHQGQISLQNWSAYIPTFEESQKILPVCNLIDNQYYSCC